MISRIGFLLLLFSFSTTLISCTKSSTPASISLQFAQKNQSLNDDSPIRHLVVNVSAPDMSLVSQEYDCRKQNCQNVNVEVTAGSNRLLQILMVYDTGTVSQILYGDVIQNLSGGDNQVEISLAEIGNFVNEGEIIGRYIPSASHPLAGKFLTGDVNVWANVGTGKPKMRILRTEIFGGWVNLFALDNLGFRFTFDGYDQQGNLYQNVPLFNDLHNESGMTLNSAGLQASQRKIARYSSTLPLYDTGPEGTEQRPFETNIIGFFGANPDNNILCSDTMPPSFSFNGGLNRSYLCRDSSCSTFFTWSDIDVQGLLNGTDSICASVAGERKVNLQHLGNDDKILDFSGPLLGTATAPSHNYDSGTATLSWRLNPSAYLPAGLEVFVHNDAVNVNWDNIYSDNDDGYNCGQMINEGFQSLGVYTGSGSLDLTSYISNGAPPAIAICAKRRFGGYFRTATLLNHYSGSFSETLATKLQIIKPVNLSSTNDLADFVCHPIMIQPVDDNNQPASLMGPIDINLITDNGDGAFYDNPNCSPVPISSLTGFHGNRKIVYYQRGTMNTDPHNLVAEDDGALLASGTFSLNAAASASVDKVVLVPDFYRKDTPFEMANTEMCIPFQLATLDTNGNLGNFAATIRFNPPTGVDIYIDQFECENSGTAELKNTDLALTGPIAHYWLGRASADTLIPDILSYCGGATCVNQNLNVVAPGPFHHFHVDTLNGPMFYTNDCLQFKIGAYDSSKPHSYPVTFDSAPALPIQVSDVQSGTAISYGGTFYSEQSLSPTCSIGGSAGPYSVSPSGGSTEYFYQYKPGTDGSLELNVDLGVELLQSLTFTISP